MPIDKTRLATIRFGIWKRVHAPFAALYALRKERGGRQGYYAIDTPDIPYGLMPSVYRADKPADASADLAVVVAVTETTPKTLLNSISAFAWSKNETTDPFLRIYSKIRPPQWERVEDIEVATYFCKLTGEKHIPLT